MKMNSLVVFASAAALPLGAAWATQPTGPQGTGWYGTSAPSFAMLDRNADGVITRDELPASDLRSERRGRSAYDGFSADTNPPVPPQ